MGEMPEETDKEKKKNTEMEPWVLSWSLWDVAPVIWFFSSSYTNQMEVISREKKKFLGYREILLLFIFLLMRKEKFPYTETNFHLV